MNYHEMSKEELAAILQSTADEVESIQSRLLEPLKKADPIINFWLARIEAKQRACKSARALAQLAEERQMIAEWKYAFNRTIDFLHGTGWVTRPVQSIQELALTCLEEEPAKVESRLAKHLEEAKCASKALYSAICMQNTIRAAKAEAGIPKEEVLPAQQLSSLLREVLESQPANTVRLAEGDEESHPIEDGTWTDSEDFIMRHLADYQHTEVVFNPRALADGVEIHVGNKVYRIQYA